MFALRRFRDNERLRERIAVAEQAPGCVQGASRKREVSLCAVVLASMSLLCACRNGSTLGPADAEPSPPASSTATQRSLAPSASAAPVRSAAASTSNSPGEREPTGTVGFLVFQIEVTACEVSTNYDAAIVVDDGDAGKPSPYFVFCPRGVPATSAGLHKYCRFHTRCEESELDAGDRFKMKCDKEEAVLEVVGGRTVLRSPLGEREIAPYPMKIAPVRIEKHTGANFGCYP